MDNFRLGRNTLPVRCLTDYTSLSCFDAHARTQDMQALELKIPPPVAAVLVGVAMWMAAYLLPAVHLTGQLRFMIAVVCALFGLIVAGLGFWAFRQAKTTVNSVTPEAASSLVTGGVYSYTRNPMYVGLTALLVGWAVWLSIPWLFLGPVAFTLFIRRFQIIPEERGMSSKFGREYDEYRKRVRRWL
jgi:protein-S-isoprenylcysteine O-methyltransferase Ste14